VEFRQNAITGTLLGQQTLASLTADQAENVTITWDITSLGLSTNTIFVLVDPADTVQEADEDNNIGALWANILPDLTVTTLDLQGDGTVEVTIDNLGIIATENISVEVRQETTDGTLVDSVLIPSLYPGISNTLTMDLGSGDFSFYVIIDPADLIPETDESNNAAVHRVAVSAKVYLPLIER
jgi:subtilase family serine protease